MCVIVYQPEGSVLSGNKFRNCWRRNKDGGGYSYVNAKGLRIRKGYFDMNHMLADYREDQEKNPGSPFLLHFRIATAGALNKKNSHPFRVRPDLVVAHNGHLIGWGSDKKSDTFEFTQAVLSSLPAKFEDNEGILELIEGYLSTDKMVFLRRDGDVTIINEQAGTWKDGCWFSNKSYAKIKKWRTSTKSTTTKRWNGHGYEFMGQGYAGSGRGQLSLVDTKTGEKEAVPLETYVSLQCCRCQVTIDAYDDELCVDIGATAPVCFECVEEFESELITEGIITYPISYALGNVTEHVDIDSPAISIDTVWEKETDPSNYCG